jgi:hypothetical protein
LSIFEDKPLTRNWNLPAGVLPDQADRGSITPRISTPRRRGCFSDVAKIAADRVERERAEKRKGGAS